MPSEPARLIGGEIRSVGPPSTSASPAPPPAAPFSVTNAMTASCEASASSSGAACCPPPVRVPMGSAASQVPDVNDGSSTIVQAEVSPSTSSSNVTAVPTAAMALKTSVGAPGGSSKVPPPPVASPVK